MANGRAMPAANRKAPIAGAMSWFINTNAPCIRALAMPRSSRATIPGSKVLLAESAKVSAVPRMNSTIRTTAMLTVPLTIVLTRTTRTPARTRSTAMTIRRRSKRSAAAPPTTPKIRTGRYPLRRASETRNGSCVSEATRSGPAAIAMPSPMLLMSVAEKSQRKLRPSLVGAMFSAIRASGVRTGGRIATVAAAWRLWPPLRDVWRFADVASGSCQPFVAEVPARVAAGAGRPKRKPCPTWTPRPMSVARSFSVSTPSAMSITSIAWAKWTSPVTSA